MTTKHSFTGYRSNTTGRFVTKGYGQSHPAKTTKEAVPKPGRGDTGRGRRRK